jgi:hypothetical protein
MRRDETRSRHQTQLGLWALHRPGMDSTSTCAICPVSISAAIYARGFRSPTRAWIAWPPFTRSGPRLGRHPLRFFARSAPCPQARGSVKAGSTRSRQGDPCVHERQCALLPCSGRARPAYASLATGGKGLATRDAIARMVAISSATGRDAVLLMPTRFWLGFMKSMDNRRLARGQDNSVILSEAVFGHAGFGGSIGFADPKAEMSFGYTMNKMGAGAGLTERGERLVDAAYRCLGYRSSASDAWALKTLHGARRDVLLGAPRMERSRDAAWRWARAHHGSE